MRVATCYPAYIEAHKVYKIKEAKLNEQSEVEFKDLVALYGI